MKKHKTLVKKTLSLTLSLCMVLALVSAFILPTAAALEEIEFVSITYMPNGASGSPIGMLEHKGETHWIFSGSGMFTAPPGKVFSHWNSRADGTGRDYIPPTSISNIQTDITIYAIWKDDPGGGGSIPPPPGPNPPGPTPPEPTPPPIGPRPTPFNDIVAGELPEQSIAAISWAASNAIFKGFEDGTFRPGATLTRACMALILWRLADCPEPDGSVPQFADVTPGVHYTALQWVRQVGLMNGFDGNARPTDNLPRYQMVTLLYRFHTEYFGLDGSAPAAILDSFPDKDAFPLVDVPAMRWAVDNKIINGIGGMLLPNTIASRENGAMVLYRYETYIGGLFS